MKNKKIIYIILILILICVLVFILAKCRNEKIENGGNTVNSETPANSNSSTPSKVQEKKEESIEDMINKKVLNGDETKKLVSKIMAHNSGAEYLDDLIYMHFETWKGTADSTGDPDYEQLIYDSLGDDRSIYNIIVDEYTEAGTIKKITIKWKSGTASEPDIPDELEYFEDAD